MALTPDNLTQAFFRDQGKHCIKVEHWTTYTNPPRRKDFLGFADYIIFDDDGFMALCQTTTKANVSARRKKCLGKTSFSWWVKAGRKVLLHGWYKKSGHWALYEEELTLEQWNESQAKKKAEESVVDTNSPLYKELFPSGE